MGVRVKFLSAGVEPRSEVLGVKLELAELKTKVVKG